MKKTFLVFGLLLVFLFVLSFGASAAVATDGDGGSALAADGDTIQFSTNLKTEPQFFSYNQWSTTRLTVVAGSYMTADGENKTIPADTAITYQWYKSTDDKVDENDSKCGIGGNLTFSLNNIGTTYYYAVATITIDGTLYTGTSNVACIKIGAANISVSLTVNNKGVIASDKDGNAVSSKSIFVLDLDADGKHTYDEALQAAHKSLMTTDDYATTQGSAGLSVNKLWGVTTSNTVLPQRQDH